MPYNPSLLLMDQFGNFPWREALQERRAGLESESVLDQRRRQLLIQEAEEQRKQDEYIDLLRRRKLFQEGFRDYIKGQAVEDAAAGRSESLSPQHIGTDEPPITVGDATFQQPPLITQGARGLPMPSPGRAPIPVNVPARPGPSTTAATAAAV